MTWSWKNKNSVLQFCTWSILSTSVDHLTPHPPARDVQLPVDFPLRRRRSIVTLKLIISRLRISIKMLISRLLDCQIMKKIMGTAARNQEKLRGECLFPLFLNLRRGRVKCSASKIQGSKEVHCIAFDGNCCSKKVTLLCKSKIIGPKVDWSSPLRIESAKRWPYVVVTDGIMYR